MSEEDLDHFALYRKAKSHEANGRYDEALSAYSKAVRINEEYAHAWFYKARLHYQLGQYNECIECAEKAMKLAPDWSDHCTKMLVDARAKIGG